MDIRVLLVTVDFHGYAGCYERALRRVASAVDVYVGLRRYDWRTRARRTLRVRGPNLVGAGRDREWAERRRFERFLRHQQLRSTFVLFVNGQQLVTRKALEEIKRRGGWAGLWMLDDLGVLDTPELDLSALDFRASFSRDQARRLSQLVGGECVYIPQGYDSNMPVQRRNHLACPIMVGAPGERRQQVVSALLARGCELELVGQGWSRATQRQPELVVSDKIVTLAQAAALYSNARPCLNVHARQPAGLNPRTFEVPGAGGLLVTDNTAVAEVFEPDHEALLWSSIEELSEKLDRACRDSPWASRIADRGMARALSEHTLERRFRELFAAWGIDAEVTATH